ncbi:H-type lectin domain-containing protein [Pseudoalteromonas sp. MMG007]|uniref:H-type lectin domain-containing protein n=1 Tax=Pseudoalteromonas sp. MMG007 TaxID=2822684 RepID=UPI001B39B401|nr:H-type lectin domain-containing protein [Pseudoalteromonas sp. MMG007]MBQ4857758.1 hypothetical protein [Pseudoalteromonas sp. MMG007]
MHKAKSFFGIAVSYFFIISMILANTAVEAVEVDVAVIYDNETKEYYNGSASTAIIAMVDQANTYLANSEVDIQLNLVATQNIDITPDLKILRTDTQVSTLRQNSGADFVTLISQSFDEGCGVGYVTTSSSRAFNIIRRSCMSRSYLHEMGHTMGLSHSLKQQSVGKDYPWGIGYGVTNSFSTLMAYESAYNTNTRTYLFSNPNYECKGYDCGIKNQADAAKALNNVKDKVASHRSSITSSEGLENGTVSVSQEGSEAWSSVKFKSTFTSIPVVIMGPPTKTGASPITVSIRNVTQKGFDFQLDEWDYLNGSHPVETVSWLAVVEGKHDWGGQQVYASKTKNVTHNWKSVSFANNIYTTPIVLAQKEVVLEGSASTIRMINVSSQGVDFFLQEEEANDGNVAGDTIHYLAITPGKGSIDKLKTQAQIATDSVTDSWENINFYDDYENAKIFSSIQSYNGTDPISLRYQDLNSDGVQISLQEEQSSTAETTHTAESVGWLILGNN